MSTVPGFTPGPANLVYSGNLTYYYNDTLIDGLAYYFKVTAVDDDTNEGPTVTQVSGTPADTVAPTQVTGVIITVVTTGNALNLQWDNLSLTVADVVGYNIYRHTVSGFSVNPIYYIDSTTNLYYNETGLTDNQTNYYLITADDEVPNEGAASVEANGTPADTTTPGQVVSLIVSNPGTGNRLTLSWNASLAADFDHYNIYRNGTLLTTRITNTYTDTGLIDNAVYIYEVSAVDEVPNEGVNSTAVGGTPTDTTPPAKVTGVVITVITTGNQLMLNWTTSAEADFAEYWLYRNDTFLINLTDNWYLDTGLTNNLLYEYKISAVDEVPNAGDNSTVKGDIPTDGVAPPAITTLIATAIPVGNTINITWNLISASDMDIYRVYRGLSGLFTPAPANLINNVSHPTLFYLDTGLTDGTTYFYKVLSVDDDGNYFPAATQASATPQDTVPPAQPANFTVTNINGSFMLNWTAASEPDFVKYEIWRNGSWILIQTLFDRFTNWYLDHSDNLLDSYSYLYEIRVYDEVGYDTVSSPRMTPLSSPSGDVTPPQNVTDLSGVGFGFEGYVRLTWSAPASLDIVYYNIYRSTTFGFTPNASNLIGNITVTGAPTYTFEDLDDSLDGSGTVPYYYQVRAVDDSNNTATGGNQAMVIPLDIRRPDPVSTFTLQPQADGSMRVIWTGTTPPDFAAYILYRIQGVNPIFVPTPANFIHIEYDNNTQTYIDSQANLLENEFYTYKLTVADEVGESSTRYAYNKTVGDTTPPSIPTGFTVINEGTGNIMNISWSANSELDVDHYNLYRNISATVFAPVASIDGRLTTSYQDTGLIEYPATNYSYYLTAVDDVGHEGLPTAIRSDITNDTKAPGSPSIVLSVLPPSRIFLIITAPADPDTTWYYVYRWNGTWDTWTGNLGDYSLVDNITKDSDPQLWADVVLPRGNYSYLVTAVDEKLQEGPVSNIWNISISLLPPDLYALTTNSNGDIILNWSRNQNIDPSQVLGYNIYRMNSSLATPILIDFVPYDAYTILSAPSPVPPFNDVEHYAYYEYGLPNGNWTYYVKTVDPKNDTSFFSNGLWIIINDTQAPGAPTNLRHTTPDGIENITLVWDPPADDNFGADVLSYEIYNSTSYITNISGWTPIAIIVGQMYQNGTIWDPPATTYSFFNFPDGIYYFVVVALDELNNASNMSNVINQTVDTTDPYIISITDVTGAEITAGQALEIYVNVTDAGGIYRVWLNYTIGGVLQPAILLELVSAGDNNSYLYKTPPGSFTAPLAGQTVNYSITVFDHYDHIITSQFFVFTVVVPPETDITMIIVLIGAVAAGAVSAVMVVSRARAKGKKKEYIAEELLPLPI